jgi:hypothetical protein
MTYHEDEPDTLVKCLCDLYDNPELLKGFSMKAYELYKGKFVSENVYNDMIDYLEEIRRVNHN